MSIKYDTSLFAAFNLITIT